MAIIASPRHDEHVHTRSLALAMAAAAQRQRDRAHRWWSPRPRPLAPPSRLADPPPQPQTSGPCLEALRTSALAQQREAIELRKAAREMWASDQEMRLRIAGLAARMAHNHNVRTHRTSAAPDECVADETNDT